jgi:hypothetical protein
VTARKCFETEPLGIDSWDPKMRAVPIRFTIAAGTLAAWILRLPGHRARPDGGEGRVFPFDRSDQIAT